MHLMVNNRRPPGALIQSKVLFRENLVTERSLTSLGDDVLPEH